MISRALFLSPTLALSTPTWANGQSSHVYIGLEARQHLPESTDLRAILESDALRDWLISGAMFPDGGYSPLSRDDYGEIAHWEPFQWSYLQWIQDTFEDRCSDEALQHVALAFGMAAHGMADQVYDAHYLERSRSIEPSAWASGDDFDAATDVVFTSLVGPQPRPETDVIPYDDLVGLFDRYGHPVQAQTMEAGQAALNLAVAATSSLGQQPDAVTRFTGQFPWGTTHQQDPRFPGAPQFIGEVVAAYWQAQWDRLHDRFDPATQWVVWTWPANGEATLSVEASDVNAQAALVFGKTVTRQHVDEAGLRWLDPSDEEVPFQRRLYYRDQSNVLLLQPLQDLQPDTLYRIQLQAGMLADDGSSLPVDLEWTVGTRPAGSAATDLASDGVGPGGPFAPEPSLSIHPPACPDRIPHADSNDTDSEAPDTDAPEGTAARTCGSCAQRPDPLPTGGLLLGLLALIRGRRRG